MTNHDHEEPEHGLSLERVVRAAIRIADADGLEALSMRRTATELDAGTMSLYRYVADKDQLVSLMVDAAFGEIDYPRPEPGGWRAKLELSARQEWAMYRRHLWVLPVVAMTKRPPLGRNVLANIEWALQAVESFGLDPHTAMQVYLTVSDYVQGRALYALKEAEHERRSGVTTGQWWAAKAPTLGEYLSTGRFPMLSRLLDLAEGDQSNDDEGFEFGLQRVLDGLSVFLHRQSVPTPFELLEVTDSPERPARLPEATAAAMELLSRRWVPELVYVLRQGDARFSDLVHAIPGISRRVLTERLRLLADEGLLRRNVATGPSTRITYSLTGDGIALRTALDHVHAWASQRGPQD